MALLLLLETLRFRQLNSLYPLLVSRVLVWLGSVMVVMLLVVQLVKLLQRMLGLSPVSVQVWLVMLALLSVQVLVHLEFVTGRLLRVLQAVMHLHRKVLYKAVLLVVLYLVMLPLRALVRKINLIVKIRQLKILWQAVRAQPMRRSGMLRQKHLVVYRLVM